MKVTHTITMDLAQHQNTFIDVVQGCTAAYMLQFRLLENKVPWYIPADASVVIRYQKPNRKTGAYNTLADGSKAYTIRDNTVVITVAPDALTVPGNGALAVSLIRETEVLTTFAVTLRIQAAPGYDSSLSDYPGCVTGLLAAPETAEIGQYIVVESVNKDGKVTGTTAVDLLELDEDDVKEIISAYLEEYPVPPGESGADGKSAYAYAVEAGYTGTEEEFAEKLAEEAPVTSVNGKTGDVMLTIPTVPSTLPNPQKLKFVGAATGEYDGSKELTIEIPSGGADVETETVLSDNLLDKSLLTKGQVFYYGSSGYQLADSTYTHYGFIPLHGAGTYRTKFQQSVHSSTGTRIALVNDDNVWVANATGTCGEVVEDKNWVDFEFVVTESHIAAGATKVAFDVYELFLGKTMIVKDREYPSEYIPYGYIEVATDSGKKQDNVLCGKTAVFLGDSICAGTTVGTDSPYYNYGWAGLIGEANHMNWTNYGRNGGTITHRGSDASCIAKIADTAIAEHPTADYVIFEGGCNDADQMREAGLGKISADYATFDTSTFSGALESLILKLVTAYPHSKIGYIIPQKMYTGYADYTAKTHIHRKYFDRAVEICQKWGIPVVDIWNGSMLNPKLPTHGVYYVEENGQHLTEAGYLAITPMIEAWMRNMYTSGTVGGGSGGGVTSWSDLTDKPFDIVELMPETQFVYEEDSGMFIAQTDFQFIADRTYIISWNGVEYISTAKATLLNDGVWISVGNYAFLGGEDNGLPFNVATVPFFHNVKGFVLAVALDGSASISVSIKGVESSALYKHMDSSGPLVLDMRYDPDLVSMVAYATKEQVFNAYVAGRPIVAIAYEGGDNEGTIKGFCQLIVCKIEGDAERIMLCGYSSTTPTITFHYNGDGTYTAQ